MSTEELEKPFGLNKELQISETIMQFRAEDMGTDRHLGEWLNKDLELE